MKASQSKIIRLIFAKIIKINNNDNLDANYF